MTKWARVAHDGVATYGKVDNEGIHLFDGTPFGEHSANGHVIPRDEGEQVIAYPSDSVRDGVSVKAR